MKVSNKLSTTLVSMSGTSGGEDPQQQVLSRTIPPAVVDHFLTKIAALEGSIKEMLDEERCVTLSRSVFIQNHAIFFVVDSTCLFDLVFLIATAHVQRWIWLLKRRKERRT